ncbi:MAG: thiamine pyrophosphate-dependent dehydrogenase E1 component subunit alpha [Desulfobacterales bacterium]|nr:thiamine pyrophosphate-dependent dehydrogenase E1 component subunit alpha [Desulfobacterales bacterium]
MKIPEEKLLWIYKKMLTQRMLEEKILELIPTGKLTGHFHLGIGEEATFIGACAALEERDYLLPTHRGLGCVIGKGIPLKKMMADIYGKATGTTKGKGGVLRICDAGLGVLGLSATLGGIFPIAMGAALSSKLLKDGRVTLAIFGDGQSNRGTFHEAINLASIWKLPVVYLCENNQYAISTSQKKAMAIKNIADRAIGYGIPGNLVDGNDALAVYEITLEAVNRARAGKGPTLIEAKTYRWRPHFEGEGASYRAPKEVEMWKKKCPIRRLRKRMTHLKLLNQLQDEKIKEEITQEIDEAVKYAEESPVPRPEDALEDLFFPSIMESSK